MKKEKNLIIHSAIGFNKINFKYNLMKFFFIQQIKEHPIFVFCLFYIFFCFYVNSNSPEIFWADDLYHLEESFLLSKGDIRYTVNGWTKPLFAIPCAGMIKLLGYNMTSCRLINIFSVICIIILLYFLVFHYTNSKILSIFASLSLAIIPIVIQTTISTLSEVEFGFFLLLGIYIMIKKKFYLSSVLIGLLPLIRSEGLLLIVLWIVYYIFTLRDLYKIFFVILLLISPSIIWSISSYFITGIFFPQVIYPLYSPYPAVPFWIYMRNIIINVGIPSFLILILSLLNIGKYDKNLKFLAIILIIVSSFHLFLAHFSLGGSMGAVEYLVPLFPLVIILETKFLHFLSKKKCIKRISLPLLCMFLLLFQFIQFYILGEYNISINRPYSEDTLMFFDLSRYFYYNILPRNESVQFCGAQIIKNTNENILEIPYQIRFQHNPDNEMPEICLHCYYSNTFTGADWVIWNKGWCSKEIDNEFVEVKPEELINENYQVVKKFDSSKIIFRLVH